MSKLDSDVNSAFLRLVFAAGCGCAGPAWGETLPPANSPLAGGITGPGTCATSGCHGGASAIGRQYVIWSQRDVHSRAFATLTSARANRMGEALKIAHPAASPTCTACHAPLQTVAPELLAANARIEDGVTCASCHGSGEAWLRSHTRHDFTHEDRVAAGMRELRNLYGRANTCVACHQNIDPALVKVGKHPALIFELDGQSASEPKHWREPAARHGAQVWLVGQAVALREMSGALQRDPADAELDAPRWAGLLWVLQRCDLGDALPSLTGLAVEPVPAAFAATVTAADTAAQRAAALAWTDEMTGTLLKKLAATSPAFLDATVAQRVQAYRAERLVLALDRLLASLPAAQRPATASAKLDALFKLAQSIPDFVPADFARALAEFERAL